MVFAVFKTVGRVEASGGSIPPSSGMETQQLSSLPQVEVLLNEPAVAQYFTVLSRPVVTDIVRSVLSGLRQDALVRDTSVPSFEQIVDLVFSRCRRAERERLIPVINATGILVHTNMGRAPIRSDVWKEAEKANCGYSNLEFDLETGKRGKRKGMVPLLLTKLTGAEDALVVNNNAAAVYLILSTFCKGKEVVVSRGEQVQIGGGFRVPEILSQSGARLVEVGTTNITTADDYSQAIGENTSMLLCVHRSNFAIRGFSSSPEVRELAAVRPEGVLLCVDQGSGVMQETIPGEISVRSHLAGGADLVCFSGDKIFSGPQAGIIVGKKDLIAALEKHPLMRVFRPGKSIYSLLEGTLVRRLNGEGTRVSEGLSLSLSELRKRGSTLLKGLDRSRLSLTGSTFTTGGGSSPDETFPSISVTLESDISPDSLLRSLRHAEIPIIGTIHEGKVHLNLATIQPEEIPLVRSVLKDSLGY